MTQNVENRNIRIPQLSFAILLLFCVILITPALVGIGTEMVILTSVFWMFVFISRYKTISTSSSNLILLSILYLLVVLIYKLLRVSTAGWEYAAGYVGWIIAEVIGIYLVSNASKLQARKLFWVITFAEVANVVYIAITGTRSIRGLGQEAGVELATAMFSTSFMLFSGVMLILLLHTKRRAMRVISIISIAVVLYANFNVLQRGTNAILTLIMFALIIMFNAKRSWKAYIISFLIMVLILWAYYSGYYMAVLEWIEGRITSQRIASRIHSINLYLQTKDYIYAGTSIRTRGILLNNTWTTFTSSFWNILVGVGDHRASNFVVGNHNELIDTLARYGVLFSLILYGIIRGQHTFLKSIFDSTKNNRIYHQTMVVFGVYLLRNIAGNAFSTAVGIVMFIFLPCVIRLIAYGSDIDL